ncbi:MAG: ATP-binding cassette domain-containing protein [Methanoregulaceae archaeon]|jgi:iron(III) transport system ATP-binding protein|nr:ATP-binding cassette domain-containing protein [Methanoregulaceae archaeon]
MIRVNDVSKEFNGHTALDHVCLTVKDGDAIAVLGSSGSGKTTLLRIIAGLEIPDHGEVWLDDRMVSGPGWAEPPYTRSTGFVFQAPALWPHMTLAENVLFGMGQIQRENRDAIVSDLFSRAGISHLAGRYPDEVSGGEARRASIIRAMAPQPKVILMDEPLTNLDSKLKDDFINLIREITNDSSVILIYVTHDEREVDLLGLDFIRLKDGRRCDEIPI